MNFAPNEQHIFRLRRGDVLVSEGSGSLMTVGASAVFSGEPTGIVCFQNTLLRLRPRSKSTDSRFLAWWARHAFASGLFASISTGANIYHLSAERVRALIVSFPDVSDQQEVADFLDRETTHIEQLISEKLRLVGLLQERVETLIRQHIADSCIVAATANRPCRPIKRLLRKMNRPARQPGPMVTAFRDGQVTARSLRRAEGYTEGSPPDYLASSSTAHLGVPTLERLGCHAGTPESWSKESNVQGVREGDIVIHGLDGFAGAIGVSESDGVCSPVYHVCRPNGGANAEYIARMLRILAVSGYLGLFAFSTRERAVDFRNWDLFGRIPIPEVDVREQGEVASLIRRIRPLEAAIAQSVELANEHRKALITAAVTGQLHFSGAAS
jgi:type I restriction enzyme, S subunit